MTRDELLQLFPAERARLVASLSRMVGPADADDLANETLIKALAAVDGFRGDAAPGTWLHRIGLNLAYDLLRRQGREPIALTQEDREAMETVPAPAESDPLERRQMSQCVQEVLAMLPSAQRQLLVQADVLDHTAPEIARQTGITAGNAKIRLHRARRALQSALEERCDFHHRDGGVLCCAPKTQRVYP
jgi:RNA polymerase sigma-70 factor (ECF subfamily)